MIALINLSAGNPYPAVCSCMAGGKETRKVLPLALVHTQVSRDVLKWSVKNQNKTIDRKPTTRALTVSRYSYSLLAQLPL